MDKTSLIKKHFPILDIKQSVAHCENLIFEALLPYMPVVQGSKYKGVFDVFQYLKYRISSNPDIELNMKEPKDIYNNFITDNWPIHNLKNIFSFFEIMDINTPIIPIVDSDKNYIGLIIRDEIPNSFSEQWNELKESLSQYRNQQNYLLNILNCLEIGVYITDARGNTIMINEIAEKTGGMDVSQLVGKNMLELVEEGYCSDSVSIKVIEEGKPVTLFQKLGDGTELIVAGKPYYENNKLKMVITTERDITEIRDLEKQLEEYRKKTKRYESELEYLRSMNIVTENIIMESKEMKEVVDLALRVAKLDTTVLIQGESGTGKEVIADIVCRNSHRKQGAFIKVNCGAVPETLMESEFFGYDKGAFTGARQEGKVGYFELASGGTLLLDEVSEIPLHLQSKFLRAIQEKEIMRIGGEESVNVDVRIIAATNKRLKDLVTEGKFRSDLYYRLNVVPITIPPLRDRKRDLEALVIYFLEVFNKKHGLRKSIQPDAFYILLQHDWPGNVRELENLIESVMITIKEPTITPENLTKQMRNIGIQDEKTPIETVQSLKLEMELVEKKLLKSLMPNFQNSAQLAKALKVDKSTVNRKLKKYGLR